VGEDLIDAGLSAIGGDEIGFPENPIFCGLQRVQTNRLTLRSHYLALWVRACEAVTGEPSVWPVAPGGNCGRGRRHLFHRATLSLRGRHQAGLIADSADNKRGHLIKILPDYA
jgi:hypothetical protein